MFSKSRCSSGSGSGEEDGYASIGDVPSLHGDEVVQSLGVSVNKRQVDDNTNNAFAVNSDHSDHVDTEYPNATNCWSDGVFESSGESTPGRSGSSSGHATAAAAAAAAGATAASLLSRQRQDSTASASAAAAAAASAAALTIPPFQTVRADPLISTDVLRAGSGLDVVGGGGGGTAATAPAPAIPQASSADKNTDTPTDQPAGGLRRRAKALSSAFLRRGASQKPTPDGDDSVASKAGRAGRGGRPSGGDVTADASMVALGPLPVFSSASTSRVTQDHVELQLPAKIINREGEMEGGDNDAHGQGGGHQGTGPAAAEQPNTVAGTAAAAATTTGRIISLREGTTPWGANCGHELSENNPATSDSDSGDDVDVGGDNSDETAGVARGMGQRTGSSLSTVRGVSGTTSMDVTVSDATVWVPDDGDDKDTIDGNGGGGDGRRGSSAGRSVGGVLSAVVPMAAAALSKVNAGLWDSKTDRRSSNSSSATRGGGGGGGGRGDGGEGKVRGTSSGSPGSDGDPPGMEALQFKPLGKPLGGKRWTRGAATTKQAALPVSEKAGANLTVTAPTPKAL